MAPSKSDSDNPPFVISRDYDAPPRLLFKAFAERQHIMKWFGPVGWPVTMCEMDFRTGGRWRMAMTGPSGVQNTPFGGTYLEMPDRKIVFDNGFEVPGAGRMVMTVTFEPLDANRTRLVFSTQFGSAEMRAEHLGMGFEQGLGSGLEQLDDLVRSLAV